MRAAKSKAIQWKGAELQSESACKQAVRNQQWKWQWKSTVFGRLESVMSLFNLICKNKAVQSFVQCMYTAAQG